MDTIGFSGQLTGRLVGFCWDEWAQMGVLAQTTRASRWATDPEALIVFTLEIARADPRLFDEVLDWTLLNEGLLSIRRLRAMCTSDADRMLVDATIRWLASERPRARLSPPAPTETPPPAEPLFHGGGPIRDADPNFAAAGLLRPTLQPSEKSSVPDLMAPINLSLRLRAVLGVGIRAEVVRVMVGSGTPRMTAQALAKTVGYAKRNVHDALAGLTAAQVLDGFTIGGEQRYAIDKNVWGSFLQIAPDELPVHLDWPQLFGALRSILRWSGEQTQTTKSAYLLASGARQLLDRIAPELAFAGIPSQRRATASFALEELQRVTNSLLSALDLEPIAPS